jgi:hypothetical protein
MTSARFLAGVVAVLPRRTLFVLPGLLLPASVASASVPPLAFMARRDGIPFGTHQVRLRHDGREVVAEISIDLHVRILGVRVFRCVRRNVERWRDGRLTALDSTTDDDGTPRRLEVRADASGLRLRGSDFDGHLPSETVPTSHWNRAMLRRPKFDAEGGRPLRATVSAPVSDVWAGRSAERLDVAGDLVLSLWYAGAVWYGLRFQARGATVTYDPA